MKRIFVMAIAMISLASCDKSKVENTVINKYYDKINTNTQQATLTLKDYLLSAGYDRNNDGIMQDSELAQIETLMAADKNITSLEGLEKMITLKKADLSNNKIETATIKNATLEELNLSGNKLVKLDISKAPRLIDKLDIRGNANLNCVQVEIVQLTELRGANNFKNDKGINMLSTTCN
ncbi:hypothetical protein [Capnocytophaga gingivalis]